VTGFAEVEAFALTLPETTSSPSYGGAPALRVNKVLVARLRGEMADDVDERTGAPYGEVLMVKVADLGEKDALLASNPATYFTVRTTTATRPCWCGSPSPTPASSASC
jgi:hypothetical protein